LRLNFLKKTTKYILPAIVIRVWKLIFTRGHRHVLHHLCVFNAYSRKCKRRILPEHWGACSMTRAAVGTSRYSVQRYLPSNCSVTCYPEEKPLGVKVQRKWLNIKSRSQ
jgi:hypothetical protein